ncbi:MAG: hypothetical protein K0R65_1697 [Crocinitomicaceae bacterium]|nr:hypothetical protein [Crocinitomicaceae bacterium]
MYGQNFISIDFIPKLIFFNYKGDNPVPPEYEFKKINPSPSFALNYKQQVYRRIHLNIGAHYHINNYYSRYYYTTENNDDFNRSKLQFSFFEPNALLEINQISIFNLEGFYLQAGAAYSISKATPITFISTLNHSDTVIITNSITPLTNPKFKFLLNIGKTFRLGESHFLLNIGFNLRLSADEEFIVTKIQESTESHQFSYNRNSSYVGLNLGLSYRFKKKIPEIN